MACRIWGDLRDSCDWARGILNGEVEERVDVIGPEGQLNGEMEERRDIIGPEGLHSSNFVVGECASQKSI